MNQTPLTDFSEIERIAVNGKTFVNADFARKLERELIQRNKDFDFISAMKRDREDTIVFLHGKLSELAQSIIALTK